MQTAFNILVWLLLGYGLWDFIRKRFNKKLIRLDGFGPWPKVYMRPGRADPPIVVIEARYASPDTMKSARKWAMFAAFGAFVIASDHLVIPGSGGRSDFFSANAVPLIFSAIIGLFTFPIFNFVFRPLLWRINPSPLEMEFDHGGITWKGEAQYRKWFNFLNKGERVEPTDNISVEVRDHRRAAGELREEYERRERRQKKKPMFYQQCSEVVIYAGRGLPRTLSVAELHDDEHGDKARALVAAINEAILLSKGERVIETNQYVPVPEQESGRRRGLPR